MTDRGHGTPLVGFNSTRHDTLFRVLSIPTLGPEVRAAWMDFIEEVGRERAALRQIVNFEINEDASAGWHFAEVRRIAREALGGN